MEKVLITGAGGFIGSHLAEKVVEEGYSVRAFIHYNSRNNWGWLENSPFRNEMDFFVGDIRDYDSVNKALQGVSTVYHLAALISIPYSYASPLAYIRTNIEGTYNVLQSALNYGIPNVLVTSTSETYGTAQYVPIDEKHPLVAQSPYSATKIAADQLAISFYRSFQLPVKIVRPFNTYGPRQSARAIIPTIITQILNKQVTIKLGNLQPTRDLLYVKDTVAGFFEIAKSDNLIGQVTNIGTKSEISIGDLIHLIANLLNANVEIEVDKERVRPENSEVERLLCDNSKLIAETNWLPRYKLEEGLIETIQWIKENMKYYKPELYTI